MITDIAVTHKFIVQQNDQGIRLDKFLVAKLPDLSRMRLKELIENDFASIDQIKIQSPSFKVKAEQFIEVMIPPLEDAAPSPQAIPLDILFEDNDLIVINKPAGMVVHPAPGNPEGTLVNALLSHCGESLSGINGVKRPGIVHRLDKETSGVLVAAKNDKAHRHLAHQLAVREMSRCYRAVVWGRLLPHNGIIEGPIGRDPRHRQRMALREEGKFARTHYKTLKLFGTFSSLVECHLDTGRTHQIRVHLSSKGCPLIGDVLYGKMPGGVPSALRAYLKEKWPGARHALHAQALNFIHPTSHEKLFFTKELPEDMENLIGMLESISVL